MPLRSHSAKDISSPIIHMGVGKGLALLAIGYLAIGLPLVHPFLHGHPNHPHGHVKQSGSVIQAAIVDAFQHDCLICHFLSASHLAASNPTTALATDVPADYRLGGDPLSCSTSSTIPMIPRGPPLWLCPPIA
jgi:hypothetical protein